MTETLLQKAQRLGIQPAGRPRQDIIEQRKKEFETAKIEEERITSPLGQAKEFVKELGEISGITPTGRRIATGISPYVTAEEELPYILEELDPGGMAKPKDLKSQAKELAEIGLDLPVISLGLSKTIARTLEKQSIKTIPELAKFLNKPLVEFAPDILKKDISTPVREKISGVIGRGTEITKSAISKTKSWVQEPIKTNVETVLKETPTITFDNYVNIAKKASENNKNITPLEYAGTRAQEALDQINRKLNTIGQNKSAVLESAVGRKPVGNIMLKFRQNLQNAIRNKIQVEGNKKVYQDILTEAEKLGDNPSALQVDGFIDFVQDRIYTGRRDLTIPITSDVQQTLRPITGELNEALKSQLSNNYRNLNSRYSELVDTRNELNLKLGVEGEKGGALMKRVFSPSDANTKKLFADVLDETNIDLVNEATLARYIMDVLGDARQKSMLEQLNISATKPTSNSLIMCAFDQLKKKANTPDELIRRARKITVGEPTAAKK